MLRFNLFWILSIGILFNCMAQQNKILVCYGKFNVNEVKNYDLIILESAQFNIFEIEKLKATNKKVVAYISMGEITEDLKDFENLKASTLGKNEDWNSYYIDLRLKATTDYLNRTIKNIMDTGYDGLFLDNIDNFNSFGPQLKQQDELVKYLESMKLAYPKSYIVQNAGIELLDKTSKLIDVVLIESVATNYTFDDKKYKLREKDDYLTYLKNIQKTCVDKNIPVILLEYADTNELYKKTLARLLKTKMMFFISKLDLQTIPDYK